MVPFHTEIDISTFVLNRARAVKVYVVQYIDRELQKLELLLLHYYSSSINSSSCEMVPFILKWTLIIYQNKWSLCNESLSYIILRSIYMLNMYLPLPAL